MTGSRRRRSRLLLACAVLLAPASLRAQGSDTLPDPFSGFSVRVYGNGLTAWFKRMPGAATTSLSLAVPFGSDRDPPGREQLAHVVEHALFAAQDGKSEEQITREIADRGGSFNASTSPDRVQVWTSVGREHSDFALDWLYQRVAPRVWPDSVLPGVRAAVALETGTAPRSALDWLQDAYVMNPRLLPPGFWQREFGIEAPEYRQADEWRALQGMDGAVIDSAYRALYSPAHMTLLVVGDLDSTAVFRHVERTFGTLPVWPGAQPPQPYRLKETPTRRFFWNLRKDVGIAIGFRLDSLSAEDHVRLLFTRELLEHRLMRRLRWGEQAAAVYGVGSILTWRGPVGHLRLYADIRSDAYEHARGVLEDELLRLRQGRYPEGEFEQDRATLTRYLRLNNGTPSALRGWHASTFYRPELKPLPPALGVRFATLTPAELSAFAARQLGPDRQVLTLERPLPVPPVVAGLGLVAAVLAGMLLARALFLRRVEMRRLRYVARLRPPLPLRVLGGVLVVAGLLAGLRVLAALLHHAAAAWLYAQDSFIVQSAAVLAALLAAAFLVQAALAMIPRKLLVLDHELRVKYFSYRSTAVAAEDIVELRLARFGEVWLSRQLLRTVPLALGITAPALLIRTRRGPDWFVSVRDTAELGDAVAALRARRRGGPDVWLAAG